MTKKHILISLFLVLAMLAALSPAGAAAVNQVAVSQEGVTYYYDAAGNRLYNAASLSGDAVVEMKKWAEQRLDASGNPIENEFLVTLQVRTTERIEELSSDTPDAAVTLVVDVSNSMDDCYHCGQEASHINHGGMGYKCPTGDTYYEGDNYGRCENCRRYFRNHTQTTIPALHDYESRLSQAQAAALEFINQFANETGAEEGDKRYAALITFGSHAAARTEYIDVATASGMLAMELAIKNITVANAGVSFGNNNTDPGGTNIEGGLMLADNMIAANTASGRALEGINYLYTILLTDGTPTYYVNGDNASASTILGTRGGGSSTTKEDVKDVGVEAAKILAHSAQSRLFSICFGTDSTGDDVWDSQPFSTWNDTT
ncbi:MAG: VWA domain-containing protein, partial [Clostridiales bacterium]|nr:VWA domain-containing protein [Clostridiales bacterium]